MNKKRRSYKGKNNPNYKKGLFSDNKKKCKDCGKKINYKSIRCKSCAKKGKLHSNWKNGIKTKKFYCIDCGKELGKNAYYSETKRCMRCAFSGKLHPNYINGQSNKPYTLEFSSYLKKSIRDRDNHKCAICHKSGKDVHHIDYDKINCDENNLITLCRKCHVKTNYNRDYWFAYFTYIMENFIYG